MSPDFDFSRSTSWCRFPNTLPITGIIILKKISIVLSNSSPRILIFFLSTCMLLLKYKQIRIRKQQSPYTMCYVYSKVYIFKIWKASFWSKLPSHCPLLQGSIAHSFAFQSEEEQYLHLCPISGSFQVFWIWVPCYLDA